MMISTTISLLWGIFMYSSVIHLLPLFHNDGAICKNIFELSLLNNKVSTSLLLPCLLLFLLENGSVILYISLFAGL